MRFDEPGVERMRHLAIVRPVFGALPVETVLKDLGEDDLHGFGVIVWGSATDRVVADANVEAGFAVCFEAAERKVVAEITAIIAKT